MMVVVLIAGIGLVVAGLLAIGYGIPINEFGFGNTLILAGTVAACTGMMLLGTCALAREFRRIAQRFGMDLPSESGAGTMQPSATASASLDSHTRQDERVLFTRDQAAAETAGHAELAGQSPPPRPWQEETTSRHRVPAPEPEPVEAAPAPKRRNLLFSSSSRKERERAQARMTEPAPADVRGAPPVAPPASEPSEPATFDDAWPKEERSRAADVLPRRSDRTPSTFTEPATGTDRSPPAAPTEEQPPVTVLKSGVVDGMAYSLYSDGSIEAQMPEGMMRFASIDELRTHLEQRP